MNTAHADSVMVEKLVQAIGVAMERASIPGITTTADLVSSVFTVLDRLLRASSKLQDEMDEPYNMKEVHRVLSDMLLEHGTTRH